MTTKYEVRLFANKNGKRVLVEARGFNTEYLAIYHKKLLNEYTTTSAYFNSIYTDAEVTIVEDKNWVPAEPHSFEWTKEDGKYIQ